MQHTSLPYLASFFAALIITLLVTPLARRIAWKLGAVDYPAARRVNKEPTARMGGIAILAGIVGAFGAVYLGTTQLGWPTVLTPAQHFDSIDYHLLAASFFVIFGTGFLDDKFQLSPKQKFAGQLLAAVLAVASGLVVGGIVNPLNPSELIDLGVLTYPITVIYLIAYVNIFNLIDGLDGLASGIACISSFTMFILAVLGGYPDAATLSVAVVGATLGFLRYNFHPASIFLGDSGSLLLGFAMGTVSLLSVTRVAGLTTIIVPLVIAGIPIIDTLSAIVRRKRANVSIGQADRGHIHHRLISEGFDQRQAVLLMYGWTALLCIGSIIMTQVELGPRIAIFACLIAGSALFALRLHLFEPVLLHHFNERTGKDELISPENPEFEEEREKFVEKHHLEKLELDLGEKSANHKKSDKKNAYTDKSDASDKNDKRDKAAK